MALNLKNPDGSKDVDGLLRVLFSWRDVLNSILFPAITPGGKLVRASLAAGSTVVDHGLRSAPSGWLVVRSVGAAAAAISEVSSDKRSITFNATAAVQADIWVWLWP